MCVVVRLRPQSCQGAINPLRTTAHDGFRTKKRAGLRGCHQIGYMRELEQILA
jgi:hypothetical protein